MWRHLKDSIWGPKLQCCPQNHQCFTMYGAGGPYKTTALGTSNHCVPAALPRLAEEHRILADDIPYSARCVAQQRIHVHSFFYEPLAEFRIFFFMKVDMDHVVGLVLLFPHAGVVNPPENLGNSYSCQPVYRRTRTLKFWHSEMHRLENRPKSRH